MNAGLITRLINLVRKTGHRVVFGDPETGQAVVVMDLAEYERLVGIEEEANAPEPYDAEIQSRQQNRRPMNGNHRQPRPEETLEVVLEKKSSAPAEIEVKHVELQNQSRTNDLTADAPKANINREIGDQKASQGKRQNKGNRSPARSQNKPANQPAVQRPKQEVQQTNEPDVGLEDEERFYLEPLE